MKFPGNLWWILPLAFLGVIGTDYFMSKWDGEPFHPWWIRIIGITIVAAGVIAVIIGAIASEKKRGIKLGDKSPDL